MDAVTPRAIASAWWEQENTRVLVLMLTALAALDSGYTLMWIGQRGLIGEINPLIKSLFEAGLGPVWWIVNVLATFLGAVFLGSCVVVLPARGRAYPILAMSLLAALKVVLDLYHFVQFYNIVELTWILWVGAVATFLVTREVLKKGKLLDRHGLSHSLHELRSEASTFIIMFRAPKARSSSTRAEIRSMQVSEPKRGDRMSVLRNWRLFFWLGVIVLAPILALSLIQLTLQMSGVLELPRWMRGLGMVSEEQGRLFFIALITIILTIAILVYSIVTVFEILSNESPRKRREARPRGGQEF